jgi:UDP-N-acetyl-D-galactosamine dehydrogenase
VADVVHELQEFGCEVSVHDPLADPQDAIQEYGIKLLDWDALPEDADAIVAAVSHKQYLDKSIDELMHKLKQNGVFMDIKSVYDRDAISEADVNLWRL